MEMMMQTPGTIISTERFITRLARWYTPAVSGLALLVAVLPPLFGLGSFQEWIYRALVLLVISCPCALLISIPLGYFGGIGAASRRGILIKGGAVLDNLRDIRVAAFDKTGTLTEGVFEVNAVLPMPGVSARNCCPSRPWPKAVPITPSPAPCCARPWRRAWARKRTPPSAPCAKFRARAWK